MTQSSDILRIAKLIDWLIFDGQVRNRRELAEKLGYTESSFSQIMNGKVKLSERVVKKLSNCDERINFEWLMTGEGEMLRGSVTQNSSGDNSPNVNGDNNTIGSSTLLKQALDEITETRKQTIAEITETRRQALDEIGEMRNALVTALQVNQEHTTRLLSLIEKIHDKA